MEGNARSPWMERVRGTLTEARGWPAGAALWLCEAGQAALPIAGTGPDVPPLDAETFPLGEHAALRACLPEESAPLARLLIHTAIEAWGARAREAELQENLHSAYDAFRALRSLVADRSLLLQPARAIRALVEEAAAQEVGTCAALWLEREDQVLCAEIVGAPAPPLRALETGLLGEVLIKGVPILENDFARSSRPSPDEPELQGARRVLALPIEVRRQILGALVLWHPQPGRFSERHLHVLQALAAQVGLLVDHNRLHTRAMEAVRLTEELEIASQIQKRLLAGRLPYCPRGLQVASTMIPCREVGGDFVDWYGHEDGTLDLLVGDVMGHGLPAAMVAAALKNHFLRYAASDGRDPELPLPSPQSILTSVSEAARHELEDLECFATCVYVRLDPRQRRVTFVDGGHPPILHYSSSMQRVVSWQREWEWPTNTPLGADPEASYKQVEVHLDPGDLLLIYTDGVTEAGPENEAPAFDQEALSRLLWEHRGEDAHEILRLINEALSTHAVARGRKDDATCILLKLEAGPEEVFHKELEASLDHLAEVRAFVSQGCASTPLAGDPQSIQDLVSAVEEHVTNVILHGYGSGRRGRLKLDIERTGDGVSIHVLDEGPGFDPTPRRELPADLRATSGRGLAVMQELCSSLRYERTPRGENHLTLTRQRRHAARSDGAENER